MTLGIIWIPDLLRPRMYPFDNELEMLPYGGRFRTIDFWIASFLSAGVDAFFFFQNSVNERLVSYLLNRYLDVDMEFGSFSNGSFDYFKSFVESENVEKIVFSVFSGVLWADLSGLDIGQAGIYRGALRDKRLVAVLKGKDKFKLIDAFSNVDDFFDGWNLTGPFSDIFNLKDVYLEPILFDHLGSVEHYYEWHISVAKGKYVDYDNAFSSVPIRDVSSSVEYAVVSKSGRVVRSVIGEGAKIEGEVIDSVIMPGARVERKSRVENSVIMPGVWIGKDVYVYKSVVGEFWLPSEKPTIMPGCRIGKSIGDGKPNEKKPDVVSNGITVIGKNVRIPRGTMIGTNCIVVSSDLNALKQKKVIEDGSFVR